jgi:D-aspartate ligase
MKARTPAVIVGGTLNALGVVRSLARVGMPIHLVVTTRWHTAAWSRFCHVERFLSVCGHNLIDGLKQLSTRLGEPAVLFLTEDKDVEVVSAYRAELERGFRFSLPTAEVVPMLADKTQFQKFAEREGFPVPRAIILGSVQDFPLLETLTPPFVIKPNNFQTGPDRHIKRVVRSFTLEQARTVATEMLKGSGAIVVQEWVDGADSDIFFTLFACDSNSRATALFSGRKLTCSPPNVGSTALCQAAGDRTDELVKLTLQFIQKVCYKGVGSLEFKLNRKTNRFVIIEPTVGRTDWQEEIATLCGVNIPIVAYGNAVGQRFEQAPRETTGVVWRSSLQYRPPAGVLPRGTKIVDGHFRLADPVPGLYHYIIEQFVQPIWLLAKRGSLARRLEWRKTCQT